MSSQLDSEGMDIDQPVSGGQSTSAAAGLFTAATSSPLAFPSSSIANPSSDHDQLAPRSVQQLRGSGNRLGKLISYVQILPKLNHY